MDLSLMNQMLNKDTIISIGNIKSVYISTDNSSINCVVSLLPENRDISAMVATVYSSSAGNVNMAPQVNDLVLVIYDVNTKSYFIIGYISNTEEPLDSGVKTNNIILNALKGSINIDAKSQINLGNNPSEPFVLGNVLISYMNQIQSLLSSILQLLQTGTFLLTTVPNSPTAPNPATAATITQLVTNNNQNKTTYIDTATTNIISQLIFGTRKD